MTNNSKRFRPSLNRVSGTKAPKSISPLPSTNVFVVAASVPFSATASGTMGLSALEALHRSALRPSGHPAARPSARLTTRMRRSEKQSMRPRSALHPCHALKLLRFYRGLGCGTPSRNEYHGPAWSLVDSKRWSPLVRRLRSALCIHVLNCAHGREGRVFHSPPTRGSVLGLVPGGRTFGPRVSERWKQPARRDILLLGDAS